MSTTIPKEIQIRLDKASKRLYKAGTNWVRVTPPNPSNIVFLTIHLVKEVQLAIRDKHLGQYKKELVVKILIEIVNKEAKFEEELQKEAVLFVIEETVPSTIDMMIGIATGEFDLFKKFKNMRKGCGLLCGC
jgi:hypothetical protein